MRCSLAATKKDYEFIASLFKPANILYMFTKTRTAEDIEKSAETREHFILWNGENPVGWYNLRKNKQNQWWFGIIIDHEWAGKGLGKLAIPLVEEQAKKKGADRLWLRTMKKNKRGFNLFFRNGFLPQNLDADNCWIMCKKLGGSNEKRFWKTI